MAANTKSDEVSPTVDVHDITWDLSNLCTKDQRKPPPSSACSTPYTDRKPRPFHHLYPSQEALHESMPDLTPSSVEALWFAAQKSAALRRAGNYYDQVPDIEYSAHSQSTSTHYPGGLEESSSSFDITEDHLNVYETSLGSARASLNMDRKPPPTKMDERDPESRPQTQTYAEPQCKPPPLAPQQTQVEVSPGVFLPLRGTQETLMALRTGDTLVLECFLCKVELCCVDDSEWVLCPDCRILTPVNIQESGKLHNSLPNLPLPHGVGLGLKTSMLASTPYI